MGLWGKLYYDQIIIVLFTVALNGNYPESSVVLDTSLLNTQHYKVGIKGKVQKSRERSRAMPYTSV